MLNGGGGQEKCRLFPAFWKGCGCGRGTLPGRAPSGYRASEPRASLGRDPTSLQPRWAGSRQGKGLHRGCSMGAFHWHHWAVSPGPCLEAGWGLGNIQDGYQGRALLCRYGGRRLGHSMQKPRWFPPRPPEAGTGSGMERAPGSKLNREGEQPRRPGECSCWKAPRSEKDRSQGD